ncbi:hypothetical protein [Dolichospermum heterosporum]|uniref:Transposase n=1 Tax=Dolichospermum heterosporum TAC447 TaxID=747523 RepID=A0ABY5LY68_9CYAN|nr:hypothetical protein [Dolichospermum heterosporum]UUO15816.1 hypothetical protein NG743_01790 [Dolichospermum heterosporum TAC447]
MTLLYLFGAISTKGEANCLQQRFAIAWVSLKNLVGAIAWFPLRIGGDRLGFPKNWESDSYGALRYRFLTPSLIK